MVLERAAVLTPMMASANRFRRRQCFDPRGLYQATPLKSRRVWRNAARPFTSCNSMAAPGERRGSFQLGMLHGAYCVGCCWALMALLFVGGVMNVLWIAAIAILVLMEEVVPADVFTPAPQARSRLLAGVWMPVR